MSWAIPLQYALVLAKLYQGLESYSHSYAQISTEEVMDHSFLKIRDGINMILKHNISVFFGVIVLSLI